MAKEQETINAINSFYNLFLFLTGSMSLLGK